MRLIAIYCCTIVPYLHKLKIGKSEFELKVNDKNYDIGVINVIKIIIFILKNVYFVYL